MKGLIESRIILNKLILIGYIAISNIHTDAIQLSWTVLLLLCYLSLNMMIYIVKNDRWRKLLLLLSFIFIGFCYAYIHHLFILLLPINLYESIVDYVSKKWIVLMLGLFPVFLISANNQLIYALVAVFSFLVFIMELQAQQRLKSYERQNDQMRRSVQKLQKQLDDHDEYIKQSSYTLKLEERNRLSQEIHDNIGHVMTSALIQMEASKSLLKIDHEKSAELLQNAIHISKDGIEKIRITLKNMKPASEQIGIQRIRLFLDDVTVKHNLQTTLVHKGNVDVVSPLQWKIIFENIRECLTNTMKYANATVVTIEIHVLNQMIKVEVKDNGDGSPYHKKGIGISGMEERAASLNGTIIIDGTHGFSVTMLLPLSSEKFHNTK